MTLLHEKPRHTRRAKPIGPHMTEDEFVAWAMSDEFARAEWADGAVIIMSPVSEEHSSLTQWLLSVIGIYVENKDLGKVYGTEFMARFGKLRRRRTPDLLFIAKDRLSLVLANHVEGSPDLIMEVVSPDSETRDWEEKHQEYERVGVREYWIVDPGTKRFEAYALGRGKRYRRIPVKSGVIRSTVIDGFWSRIDWLWAETRPHVLVALRELGLRV
jgi:Uma2 family endonuclease